MSEVCYFMCIMLFIFLFYGLYFCHGQTTLLEDFIQTLMDGKAPFWFVLVFIGLGRGQLPVISFGGVYVFQPVYVFSCFWGFFEQKLVFFGPPHPQSNTEPTWCQTFATFMLGKMFSLCCCHCRDINQSSQRSSKVNEAMKTGVELLCFV